MSRKAVRVFNWKGIFYYTIYDDAGYNCKWDSVKFIDWFNKNYNTKKLSQKNPRFYYHLGRVVEYVYNEYLKDE